MTIKVLQKINKKEFIKKCLNDVNSDEILTLKH